MAVRVCIGSHGQFHAYDLARQMERLGQLKTLYTGFPRWKVKGVSPDRVATFPWMITALSALSKVGVSSSRIPRFVNGLAMASFDRWMARQVAPCDVFHCMTGTGTAAHRAAKGKYGALTVCDRGSSHIVYQDEILSDEYSRWGIPYKHIDARTELDEYRECDVIVVPSTFAYRSFVSKGVPEDKLAKIPYGVDLSVFHQVPKEDEVFRVLYVGAMTLRKGLPYLLEAIAGLRIPGLELWLVGSESSEARRFFGKYEGKFRFLGPIPRHQLYWYYSQASVFAIASVEEGLALVQAQALACGLPVIATTNTGAEDLFTNGVEGYIVPIRDPDAIRERIAYLFDHSDERKAMSEAARDRVASLGGWDTYGQRMSRLYSQKLGLLQPAQEVK